MQVRLQTIAVGLYSYLYMEPFVLMRGESTPVTTLYKLSQTMDVFSNAYKKDGYEEWWETRSQCVGIKIGDPVNPVSAAFRFHEHCFIFTNTVSFCILLTCICTYSSGAEISDAWTVPSG